jgi:nitrogen-specific signal transduction histidine kinase
MQKKTVMNQSKGEDDAENNRRRYAEVPFEQFERIKKAVNRLVAKPRNPANTNIRKTTNKRIRKLLLSQKGARFFLIS